MRKKHQPGCPCCDDDETCGTLQVTVYECVGTGTFEGAEVTLYDADGVEVGSSTTDASGVATVDVPAAGNYTIRVDGTGYPAAIQSRALSCSANEITVFLGWLINVTVAGCSSVGLAGATVTATFGGVVYRAANVTDSSGLAQIAVSTVGSHTISAVHPSSRFTTYSGSASVSVACTTAHTAVLPVASPYVCVSWGAFSCGYPVAKTLHLTDPSWGNVTLTYDGVDRWLGTLDVAYPVCFGCAAVTTRFKYEILAAPATPPATNFGSRSILRTTSRNHTAPGFGPCPASPSETLLAYDSAFNAVGIASRTCPDAFFLTTTAPGGNECDSATAAFTITE